MATKLQNISELARQTTERLTQSVDNWKRFLDSAAWLYKYPFHEQVLIHAQRPDAKACAPIELWNSRFRRWVNRGAKGIAIIDDSGHKPALRYVFDVSDTNTRYNIPFRLWQTKSQYTAQIIEELQNHFGDTGVENADIAATVLGISINAISDNYRDYYEELLKAADNSALADISDDEISSTFVLQLMTSVSHTVLVRLGIDPAAIFHGDEYESIRLFNSPDTIVQLGTATSDISEMILRQIERSVRSMERQERGTLANVEPVLQNEGRNSERSDENGTQLQAERGLPDSRYQNGRSADGDDRQIRQNAEDVSQGASERDLQLPAASEQADGASVGDRQDGAGTGRTDDGADGADRERDREDESRESDALDSANEQHSAESRGDGAEQPNLRITTEDSLFPTLEEQIQHIEEAEAQKLSAFSVSQADIDNELCRHGSGFANGKLRIYKFFEDMPSSDAAITFLKKEYGIGGHSHTYLNGESGFVDHDGKGIHFSNYNYKEKHTITWKAVARRLRELIAIDRYLTEKEKAYLPEYEAKEAERRLQLAEEAAAREALRAAAAAMDERRKEAQYAFSLGDTVQLGATTYTILGYDEHMLKITNDGRKLALDQRLTDDLLPDDPESKVNLCLDNIHRIWESSSEQKSTQLVFCDLSTPHGDGKFNVYNDLKAKLIRMGVPEAEIAFIHDAKTEAQKAALFTNVRSGNVRILLGSTAKMGAGTNVQKRLIAEHHLDIPWRPSDIEQREGRILRQGNENSKVDIFRYVTENTFDSYMWQTIESKQKFISQIMTSKSPVRSCEDVDETALSYAEIKALATGNPYIREKMDLEIEVSRLKLVKANYLSQKYMLEDSLLKHYPKEIRLTQERIKGYAMDIALYERHKSEDFPGMLLYGTHYEEKKEAGTAILEACKAMTSPEPKEVGSYRGFTLLLSYDIVAKVFRMTLRGELSHTVELGSDIHGNIQRMENVLESLPSRLSACEKALATLKEQMENAKAEVEKPFEQEQELSEKAARLAELNALLNMDKRENAALDAEPEHTEIETVKASCKER